MKRIRPAEKRDLVVIHALAIQLGYPSTVEEFSQRFYFILSDSTQKLLVAEEDTVLGWIHFQKTRGLVDPEYIEIKGLVVDESQRGQGIGALLMKESETWAIDQKLKEVRFSSNIIRERAHKLYLSLGYAVYKTSLRFIKKL